MPGWVVPIFLFAAFAIFFALTRVIVEAGLSSAVEGLTAGGFVVSGFGSSLLGPGGLVAVGYTLVWAGDLLVFAMAPCANGIRLLHEVKGNRKRILAMMAAALVGTVEFSHNIKASPQCILIPRTTYRGREYNHYNMLDFCKFFEFLFSNFTHAFAHFNYFL